MKQPIPPVEELREAIEDKDAVFIMTYDSETGFEASGYEEESLDALEALAFANFMRSYAREMEGIVDEQSQTVL